MFMQNDGTVKAVPSFCAFKKIKQIRFRLKSEDFSRTKKFKGEGYCAFSLTASHFNFIALDFLLFGIINQALFCLCKARNICLSSQEVHHDCRAR